MYSDHFMNKQLDIFMQKARLAFYLSDTIEQNYATDLS